MATRYCDLDKAYHNGATVGDSAAEAAGGPGGLQSMFRGWGNHDKLDAGDVLWIQDTGDLQKWIKITVDVDKSGVWAIGDQIQNHNDGGGANGDDWDGSLVFIDATTLWVQLDTAGDIDDIDVADGVYNVDQVDEIAGANMTAADAPGIVMDGNENDGTGANGYVWLRGTTDLTDPANNLGQWPLDAQVNVGSTAADHCLDIQAKVLYWRVHRLTVQNAADDNIDGGSAAAEGWHLFHMLNQNAGVDGIDATLFFHSTFEQCICKNAADDAVQTSYTNNIYVWNRFSDNGANGLGVFAELQVIVGCGFYDNAADAISNPNNHRMFLLHNFFDKQDGQADGFDGGASDDSVLFANRFSHHTGNAIDGSKLTIEDWNVFHGNANNRNNVDAGDNSIVDDVNDGYVNAAAHDYNVTDGADIHSEGINLDWD